MTGPSTGNLTGRTNGPKSSGPIRQRMKARTRSALEFVAAQLTFAAGLIHLVLGAINWLRWLQTGLLFPRDLRWPLFTTSGLVVLAGLYMASQATDRRPYYAAGIVAMLGYAGSYFGWHLGGHRPLFLIGPSAGGETISIRWFLDHALAGPIETVALAAEIAAAVALLALLLAE